MKKTLIIAGVSLMLFSCNKNTTPSFTPSSTTGTTTFSGNIMMQQANNGNPAPNTPAIGVQVAVTIMNSALYPNSPTATGSQTYYATTNSQGNFSMSITTNGNGAFGTITVSPINAIYDPIAGTQATFNVSANPGGHTFTSGVPWTANYTMNVGTILSTNNVGSATVIGKVEVSYLALNNPGMPHGACTPTLFPLANDTVYLNLNEDPASQKPKIYKVATSATGTYTITVATSNSFPNAARIYTWDYVHTNDTVTQTGPSSYTVTSIGQAGYYQGQSPTPVTGGGNLPPGTISNQNYENYFNFIPN